MPEQLTSKLHIALCDDDPADRRQLTDLTGELLSQEGLACELTAFETGAQLLAALQKGLRFHILLLDVMMPGLDGMELAAAVRWLGNTAAIIFVSSNRDLALRGYEVAAARYLAKPLQPLKLREALLYCSRTFYEHRELLLPTEKGQSRLDPAHVTYAEPWQRGTRLHLTGGTLETSMKFSDLAATLPGRCFTLCHRTVLVNLAFVRHLRGREIELADGKTLPVSKYRVPQLKKQLLEYLND